MKMKIVILVIILSLASSSAALARGGHGGHHRHHRDFNDGIHFKTGHHRGAEIAFGVLGGILLGSALIHKVVPPPRSVEYGVLYGRYPQGISVRQPKICFEDRVVSGQWQTSSHDGRQIWVQFSSPVTQRLQVPCY